MPQTPPKHKTIFKDGYELTFYPGFLGRATVTMPGEEMVVLYQQEASHDIRDQPDEPLKEFLLQLSGGEGGRSFALRVDDPEHAIAEIVVRLHPRGHTPGTGVRTERGEEVVVLENHATFCPPLC